MKTNSILQLFEQYKVVVPPIQRDYAQGRGTGKIPHIRARFLDAIVNILSNDALPPMELDFVYGYIENDKSHNEEISVFKPLDGQQRLTTLFLIHWYIACKEGKMDQARKYLKKFSYATRKSSRDFCEKLIDFNPQKNLFPYKTIGQQIENQPWFFSAWLNDPTIASMLVVLKAVEDKFQNLEHVWEKLTGNAPRMVFHLLPMEDLGLPDDLYIKMNARGKGLTDFEHFKSQFSEILEEDNAILFNEKIDKEWSDLFWNIFKDKQTDDIAKDVDNGFLSFFWFITDILIKKNPFTIKSTFWLDIIKEVYEQSSENVCFLFDCLNLFEHLEKDQVNYFNDIFYIKTEDFEINKTRIFFNNAQTNLFRKCAETYGFGNNKNLFSVGEQLLLYSFIFMKLKMENFETIKFRLLRNIIASSEDQMRNEYLQFLYEDVETIIQYHEYSQNSKLSKRQFEEENRKRNLIEDHSELKETIYKLEDHTLLRGNIALFDFNENISDYAAQFHKIFVPGCQYFEISRAMLCLEDYTQDYGRYRRFGNNNNSTWREIFTQSEKRKGFDNTRKTLKSYLEIFISDQAKTNESIIQDYLKSFENAEKLPKSFLFYYIKYESFRFWNGNQTDGFYCWNDYYNNPYECWMLNKQQFNGRHWNPFLLQLSHMNDKCSLENYGNILQFTNGDLIFLIKTVKNGFKFLVSDGDEYSLNFLNQQLEAKILNEEYVLVIHQDEGIDLEDRIIKVNDFLLSIDTTNL